jgi:parallel beta-helix repeat protein
MKKFITLFIIIIVKLALSDTTEVSGNVSGIWSIHNSPYAVVGEITVLAGETLDIEPGVEIRFRGGYHFIVNGWLKAVGGETDSIIFTRDQPIEEHKWKGIRFVDASPASGLAFCRIEYVKNDGAYPEVRGGAVYCENSSPIISHCALGHNYSHNANYNGGGGGVFVEEGSPVVEYCHIFDNYVDSGGGICTLEAGAALLKYNVIEDNTALYAGGGMYLGVRSAPIAIGNIIRRNSCSGGWGGGGINLWNWYAIAQVSKTIFNNLIYHNSASDAGGGIYTRYDLSFIYNNTIVENTASRGGGIYVLNEGQFLPDVRNCILWDNLASSGSAIHLDQANNSQINIAWSDIENGWSGNGNFDSIPNFEDTVWFRLASPSRCIDAGTSDNTPVEDFEENGRFDDPGIPNRGSGTYTFYDVGWDEYVSTGIEETSELLTKPQTIFMSIGESFSLPKGSVLFNLSGRIVFRSGQDSKKLSPGIYFINFPDHNGLRIQKLIVLR